MTINNKKHNLILLNQRKQLASPWHDLVSAYQSVLLLVFVVAKPFTVPSSQQPPRKKTFSFGFQQHLCTESLLAGPGHLPVLEESLLPEGWNDCSDLEGEVWG